ncbi:MAG: helix-turn-helix domain-containing protein [Bacteroides sp.]|nr:helix-turn-helix domain-containing protein [Bacillota bacterium]MCM1394469.1 helix-turn-helix domain-containing protein [[Eubacterium] siraeum]MCM1455714.1 helix-turn-helix domain-containing protein [Bacteroides sp.]
MIQIAQIQSKLSEALKNCELTQVELANRLNVTQSIISDYIREKKSPSLETFANLCAILDLDIKDILCIDSYKD